MAVLAALLLPFTLQAAYADEVIHIERLLPAESAEVETGGGEAVWMVLSPYEKADDTFTIERLWTKKRTRVPERKLNDAHPDGRFEVLNIGLSGLTFPHVLERIEALAVRFRPHLVVYGWTINDIEGPAYRASAPLASFQARYDRFKSSPSFLLRALWPRWVSVEDRVCANAGIVRP